MIDYKYMYLIGSLFLLIIWGFIFLKRKDLRKELIFISSIWGILALLIDPIYYLDWWHAETIIKTNIRIESFLCAFASAGIGAVIYSYIFKKRTKIKKSSEKKENQKNWKFFYFMLLFLILFFGSFFILDLNSVYSTIISSIIMILILWVKRTDLIINSLVSGIIFATIALLPYFLIELVSPGWVQASWKMENLSGIMIINTPLEDTIWWFLWGLLLGPSYEYWKEAKEIKLK